MPVEELTVAQTVMTELEKPVVRRARVTSTTYESTLKPPPMSASAFCGADVSHAYPPVPESVPAGKPENDGMFGFAVLADVVPTDAAHPTALYGIGQTAARHLEMRLRAKEPIVVGIGTGRSLKAAVDHMTPMDCPQHRVVSMTANISPDGAAAYYNVIFNIADKTKARSYPWPLPVFANSVGERDLLLRQNMITANLALLKSAATVFIGIGGLGDDAPLILDGFLSVDEMHELEKAQAIGEICGWVFNAQGALIDGLTNERVTSAPIPSIDDKLVIAVAHGERKVAAIRAAITRPLVNGLITDEATAEALLRP